MTPSPAEVARVRKRLKVGGGLAVLGFILVTGAASSGRLWILPVGAIAGLAGSAMTLAAAVGARRLAKGGDGR